MSGPRPGPVQGFSDCQALACASYISASDCDLRLPDLPIKAPWKAETVSANSPMKKTVFSDLPTFLPTLISSSSVQSQASKNCFAKPQTEAQRHSHSPVKNPNSLLVGLRSSAESSRPILSEQPRYAASYRSTQSSDRLGVGRRAKMLSLLSR